MNLWPAARSPRSSPLTVEAVSPTAPVQPASVQEVSSAVFVNVYTPFVWGRASADGLGVEMALHSNNQDCLDNAAHLGEP